MSEQPINGNGESTPPAVESATPLDPSFESIFSTVAPEVFGEATGEGTEETNPIATGDGQSAPAVEVPSGQAVPGAAGDSGNAGEPDVQDDTGVASGGEGRDGSVAGAVAYDSIKASFGEMSTALETRSQEVHQQRALKEVQEEFPKYFDALRQHPRQLIGQQVPSTRGEGMETLRDSNDAKDWQDAVKSLLVDEINDRASRSFEADNEMLSILHSSIELFQNNNDLVPRTKEFDKELADQFAKFAKPYEVRVNGKLHGYSVPVQPMVEHLRAQLAEQRKAAKAAPPPAPKAPASKPQAAPGSTNTGGPVGSAGSADPGPQAGIKSKAGQSTETEDFSVLFGTIGLPTLRI